MPNNMPAAHLVFVHGACHGAWCWYKVMTLLQILGHNVTCLDLGGAGINLSDADHIATFKEYNRPLTDFMSSLPDTEQVILVGHSAGGGSVTDAILRFPEKIQLAIYVVGEMTRGPVPGIVSSITQDVVIYNYGKGPSEPPTSLIFRKEVLRKLLYHRSPIQDATLASMAIRRAPLVHPRTDPDHKMNIDEMNGNLNKVKRVYIRTLDDHWFSVANQNLLIEAWPPWMVFDVDSDHSPFFSAPEQLVAILLKAISAANL